MKQWDVYEVRVKGPSDGNPFTEHTLRGEFRGPSEYKSVNGFYDGNGEYCVRFMPSEAGEYLCRISGDFFDSFEERFTAEPAEEGVHGPVRVQGEHFVYADGTPYYSLGTTCYVWELQEDERVEETLGSLEESAFNKLRFCIFPKHYAYNLHEPRCYPYEGTPMDHTVLTTENFSAFGPDSPGNRWCFDRFKPEYFRHIESCISRLGRMGIEADLILFHPYDRWGFSQMTAWQDDLYLRYVVARLAAYRNVWWSLANEYDLIGGKTKEDWDRIGTLLMREDPWGHPRSIHNCFEFFDHSAPYITHCSIQRQDLYKTAELTGEWRGRWHKPVVEDEIAYEGSIAWGWGNLTAEEMTRRFWECAVRGGYPGHGETLPDEKNLLWWSHGGRLRGESPKRFQLLRDILNMTPGLGLTMSPEQKWDEVLGVPEEERYRGSYYLYYYSFMRLGERTYDLPDGKRYHAYVIDTWNMTREYAGVFSGSFTLRLPGRPYMAVQLICEEQETGRTDGCTADG